MTSKEQELFKQFSAGGVEKLAEIVGSEAKTEHLIEMNGNATKNTGVPFTRYVDMKFIDKETGEKIEVSANAPVSPYTYKYIIRLDEKPVFWEQIQSLDPNLRATKGMYMIKYTPPKSKDYKKGRPFKIGQDLIRWDIRVSGRREWGILSRNVPEIRWLARNSTLTDDMFLVAKMHPGMTIWFTIKWVEYVNKLQSQVSQTIDLPLGARKCSYADYKKLKEENPENKTITIRYWGDILKEINEAEANPEVQAEMLAEANEGYDRSRKMPRDPVNGRFLKKEKEEEKEQEGGIDYAQ